MSYYEDVELLLKKGTVQEEGENLQEHESSFNRSHGDEDYLKLSAVARKFVDRCRNYHTSVNAFIHLYNNWGGISPEERGEVIDYAIKKHDIDLEYYKEDVEVDGEV